MDDPELETIRQRRLAEMQAQAGMGRGAGMNPEEQQRQMEARREMEERRKFILAQVLSNSARERLSRVALVKPEKARKVEDMIIMAAQTGQLGSKLDENGLIRLLEQISERTKKETKVMIKRRNFDEIYGGEDD